MVVVEGLQDGQTGPIVSSKEAPRESEDLPAIYTRLRCTRLRKRMVKSIMAISLLALALVHAETDELMVTPTIDSIGVFKNGVAVVRASFPVEKPGVLCWDRVPQVVHGTFQVENQGELTVRTTLRTVEQAEERELPNGVLQNDLSGKTVEVTLRATSENPARMVRGTVWQMPERLRKKRWDTDFTPPDPWSWGSRSNVSSTQAEPPVTTGSFLVLEGEGGREYLNTYNIEAVKVTGPFAPKVRKVEKPVMLFDARKVPAGSRVVVSYLTKGMAWTPAYRVDFSDPAKLILKQTAVIRNELMDLKDTEVSLISGFPNMTFAHVNAPLAPDGSLAAFFQQLSQQPRSGSPLQSQMISYNAAAPNQASAPDTAERGAAGDDVHFENIGKRSLDAGDSLAMEIASGSAAYQRVVEWVVPDGRDERGRYVVHSNEPPSDENEPWDAVKFANPLKFPMTTAPALIMEKGRFRGQSLAYWTNPGQQACLRITKALTISAQYAEIEEEASREHLMIGGHAYRRAKVKGTFTLRNSRNQAVKLNVRKQFSGEMIGADDAPQSRLSTEGVRSVNPRRELEWNIDLPAGGEKTITFRYSVLTGV